jgi:hypothetical protein
MPPVQPQAHTTSCMLSQPLSDQHMARDIFFFLFMLELHGFFN